MQVWFSRIIAALIIAAIVSVHAHAFDQKQLAWINSVPANKVVELELRTRSHSYTYHLIVGVFAGAEYVAILEVISWGLRRLTKRLKLSGNEAPDQAAVGKLG